MEVLTSSTGFTAHLAVHILGYETGAAGEPGFATGTHGTLVRGLRGRVASSSSIVAFVLTLVAVALRLVEVVLLEGFGFGIVVRPVVALHRLVSGFS